MAANLNVVEFPGPNINDIPERLRSLADLLEHGAQEGTISGMEDTDVFIWINVTSDGSIESGALGKCHNKYQAIGIMQAAAAKLSSDDF